MRSSCYPIDVMVAVENGKYDGATVPTARKMGIVAQVTRRRLNKSDLISDGLLALFVDCFAKYRDPRHRARLLKGIIPEPRYGQMTIGNAAIFICFLIAVRKWPKSDPQIRAYRDARWRSEHAPESSVRFYTDLERVRKLSTIHEAKRIEALVAISFAHEAGYRGHSRALWRSIEGALKTDVLANDEGPASSEAVNSFFESLRLRLYAQAKTRRKGQMTLEAASLFGELAKTVRKNGTPADLALLKTRQPQT